MACLHRAMRMRREEAGDAIVGVSGVVGVGGGMTIGGGRSSVPGIDTLVILDRCALNGVDGEGDGFFCPRYRNVCGRDAQFEDFINPFRSRPDFSILSLI